MNPTSKKVKIGLVGPTWPFRGGIAKFTTELAKNLSSTGHLSLFISPQRQYPKVVFPGGTDIDKNSCKKLAAAKFIYSYYEPWTWKKVIKEIESSEADCIVAPHWSMASAPFLRYLIRNSPKPVIPIVHNFVDHDSLIRSQRLSGWILNGGAGYLHHNPEFSKLKFFKKRINRVVCNLHPVTNVKPLNSELAKKSLGVPEGLNTFLFYGLIRPYKGLEILLEAIELLPEGLPIAFLIAGEPWKNGTKIESKIKKLQKKYWIGHQLSWISEAETALWFSAADAVVLPYLKATGSGVAAQAFAFQKPILTTQTGSLAQLVRDGVNGLLCKPGSSQELAERIQSFLDPKLRKKLQRGMRQTDPESWGKYVESLVSLAEISVADRSETENLIH